jgi:hypothetical protein
MVHGVALKNAAARSGLSFAGEMPVASETLITRTAGTPFLHDE